MYTILHIGAGQASELPQWLESGAEHIVLVEPNPELAEQLRKKTAQLPQVTVVEAAVTTNAVSNELQEYNLPEASSLRAPSSLKKLFPGLKALKTHSVATLTPAQLLEQYSPEPGQPATLVLQAPGEEQAIIEALAEVSQLNRFSHLAITANPEPLYEGSEAAETLLNTLQGLGYNILQENWQDQVWPSWELGLDVQYQRIKTLEAERDAGHKDLEQARQDHQAALDKLTEHNEQLTKQLEASQQHHSATQKKLDEANSEFTNLQQQLKNKAKSVKALEAERDTRHQALQQARQDHQATLDKLTERNEQLTKQLEETQQHHSTTQKKLEDTHGWFMSRKQQTETQAETLKELEAELEKAHQQQAEQQATITKFGEQFKAQQQSDEANKTRFSELESKLDQLFGEQRSYIQQTTSALGQHVTRTAKHQRDEQALAGYLAEGRLPFSTQLPSSYAFELLKHYHEQRYDVVVIMGSAEATYLLAHAACGEGASQAARPHSAHAQLQGQSDSPAQRIELSADDLPQAIISVEHRKADVEALQQALAAKRHHNAVSVVHAPWVECRYQEQSALFYACSADLQRLSQWLNSDARVLVIVGDALAEAGHSRVAALPQLLQHLPTQQLDVVLQGNSYSQESDLMACWDSLLEIRQRQAQKMKISNTHSLRVEG